MVRRLGHRASSRDVGAAPGHVGGHGDAAGLARGGHDAGLVVALLGVEYLMGDGRRVEPRRDAPRLRHRGAAHQHCAPVPRGRGPARQRCGDLVMAGEQPRRQVAAAARQAQGTSSRRSP
ncbi:MAG: hypothetical protein H6948_07280 [Zoogloeaceae bacterium]|nr:hypothetical protein [Zoogloeaceae bacterium]